MSCALPAHLAEFEATGLVENETIAQFEIGDYRNFVYLILDWSTRRAVWVDPQKDLTAPLSALERHGFVIDRILLTHSHSDHTAGVPELATLFPRVPITLHEAELFRIREPLRSHASLETIQDGATFVWGHTRVRTLHTPGHSAGECSFLVESNVSPERTYLLTGDTLFIRDCGNTSQATGDNEQMFASLQRIKSLPSETIILPGHHYARETASVLEKEMKESPPFLCRSVEELAAIP